MNFACLQQSEWLFLVYGLKKPYRWRHSSLVNNNAVYSFFHWRSQIFFSPQFDCISDKTWKRPTLLELTTTVSFRVVLYIHRWFSYKLPDLDGSVRQNLPVAGPAAVGAGVVAGRLGGAYGPEVCLLWTLTQVFEWNQLMMPRLETKLPYPVNLYKWVVKLRRKADRWETDERDGGGETNGWMDEGTDVTADGAQVKTTTLQKHLKSFISKWAAQQDEHFFV